MLGGSETRSRTAGSQPPRETFVGTDFMEVPELNDLVA